MRNASPASDRPVSGSSGVIVEPLQDEAARVALQNALKTHGLPVDDLDEPGRLFWFASDDGEPIGFVGVEGTGSDRLLRSLVVLPAGRRRGIGRRLVEKVEREAVDDGCRKLHLLTTTAEQFFSVLGYIPTERDKAPSAIAESEEFANLCPSTAAYMVKDLSALRAGDRG